jgi:hypothetical protein
LEELTYSIGKNKPTSDPYAPAFTSTASSPNIELLPNIVDYITELPQHIANINEEQHNLRARAYNLGERITTNSLKNPANTTNYVFTQLQAQIEGIPNWTREEKTKAVEMTNAIIQTNMQEIPNLVSKSSAIQKEYNAIMAEINVAEESGTMTDEKMGGLRKKKEGIAALFQ